MPSARRKTIIAALLALTTTIGLGTLEAQAGGPRGGRGGGHGHHGHGHGHGHHGHGHGHHGHGHHGHHGHGHHHWNHGHWHHGHGHVYPRWYPACGHLACYGYGFCRFGHGLR